VATPKCVIDYPQLRNVPVPAAHCDYIFVAGSSDPGKSGIQGFFAWRNESAAKDDSGTAIKPNALSPQAKGRWHRVFDGAMSVKWFGAIGDGKTDDTKAIQASENAAAAVAGAVYFPAGVYVVNGAQNAIPNPNDPRRYGIEKKSKTKWVGDGYASSILKLKDKSTSDPANPGVTVDPQMVYANSRLQDIGFYRLGFDLNGANNTLTSQANVAAIWLNGEQLMVRGMVVEGCKFSNGPGGTVILVQNRATSWPSGYPLDDVLIRNNRFEDNCLSPSTIDHSTMNIWARRTRVIGNLFQQTAVVPPQKRYIQASAVEFHGGDSIFAGNVIRSYGSVVIPSENFIEPWENLLIANNVASDLGLWFTSTQVWTSPDTKPIDKIVIRGNHVVFNDYFDDTGGGLKGGLIQNHYQPISYIEVSDNYFEMASPNPVIWPVGVTSPQASPVSRTIHLKVADNTFSRMEFGTWVDNNSLLVQVENLEFVNNTCLNMQDVHANPANQEATGLWADGSPSTPIENLVVAGNRFVNEADNDGYKHGVELRLNIDNLYLGADNAFYNIKAEPVWEQSLAFKARGPVIETSSLWDPGNVGSGGFVSTDVAVAGAELGDLADASFSLDVEDLVVSASVTAPDTVTVTLTNDTTSDVDLNQGTVFTKVTKASVT
jgi:Pectate lyase superfamily protein